MGEDSLPLNEDAPAGWRRGVIRVAFIGLASAALYLILYATQRAMFENGLDQRVADTLVRGEPADVPMLLLQSGGYFGATLALFSLYLWLLILCRNGSLGDVRARTLALLFPVLFNAGLLFGRPYQSIDALTYVAHGYMADMLVVNPHASAAAGVAGTALGPKLAPFGWLPVHGPSPYGPLWTHVETLAFDVSENVSLDLLLLKTVVVAASLGSAALIWKILGRVRPQDQLLGTLVYLWNPVIVVEFAAEGHNDALMILCLLASLALCVSGRPALSVVASVLGILVKYVPVIFLPAQLVYLWHTNRDRPRLAPYVVLGLLVGGALAVLLYSPYWIGAHTFEGVRLQGQPLRSVSPSGWLYGCLSLVYPQGEASWLTLWTLACAFGVFVVVASRRARQASGLLGACAAIALVYVLVVSTHYWPWYASLPLALVALKPEGVFLAAALVLTLCSRLVAPLSTLFTNGFIGSGAALDLKMAIGVTVPLAVLLLLYLAQQLRPYVSAKE